MFQHDARAQSEVIGTLLLTALVILVVVTTGALGLAQYTQGATDERPLFNCQITYAEDNVTVTHGGGDSARVSDLDVVFRNASSQTRIPFSDGEDQLFETGDSARFGSLSTSTDVLVVTGNSIVCQERLPTSLTPTPGTPTPTPTPTPTTPTPTPTPPAEPTLSGYLLQDTSANSNTEYTLFYDVENTAQFDRVEVTFDNRNNDWGDETITSADARGNVTFSQGGEQGSTYDVTIRVFDDDGTVTDEVTFADVADGDSQSEGNVSQPDSPEFAGTVVDDLGGTEANYEVSYNVTNRSNFGSVRVRYENLDNAWASATYTSSDPRTNVDDYAEADFGGTGGDEYRITIELLDSAGVVVDERVVTDVADGDDPSGNAALSRPTSPTLDRTTIQDRSRNSNAEYRIQYRVSDPDAEFTRTEVLVRNVDNTWASTDLSSTSTNDNLVYSQGGTEGDTYRLTVRVLDVDGIVVDEYVVTDVADGTDPDEPTATSTSTATPTAEPTTPANQPPTADFTANRAGQSSNVDLDGSPSNDPDGTIVSYEWDVGDDGTTDYTGQTVDNANVPTGTSVTLVVTDDDGATDTVTRTVD